MNASEERSRDAMKIWCMSGVEFPRYLMVSKKSVQQGAVECGRRFFSAAVKFVVCLKRFLKGCLCLQSSGGGLYELRHDKLLDELYESSCR